LYVSTEILTYKGRGKAVADGAISFHLDHFVQSRVAKVTYGTFGGVPYDPNDAEHVERQDDTYFMYSGKKYVSNRFFVVLPKVCLNFSSRA
jgi:hypothetical protein